MGEKQESSSEFRYSLKNGAELVFGFQDDCRESLTRQDKSAQWTELSYKKCQDCPLDENEKVCPAAVSIEPLVKLFKYSVSSRKALLSIPSKSSSVISVPVESALASIYLEKLSESSCPVLNKLAFLSVNEKLDHIPSDDKRSGIDILPLAKKIRKALYYFSRRVSCECEGDAGRNALVRIDTALVNLEMSARRKEKG